MRRNGLRMLVWLGCLVATSAAAAQELTWLPGHRAPLYAVRYSPDGKTLVSSDVAGGVTVWDRASGEVIRSLREHRGAVLSVAINPAGRQFATAGIDRTIRVYDLPFRGSLAAMTSFSGDPAALAVSPDGKRVVTGDSGRLVRRWNLENNQAMRDFSGSTTAVVGVVLHPQGETVIAACDDGSLRAWNLGNGNVLGTWTGPPLSSLAMHPEGNFLAAGGTDGLLRLLRWPVAANRQLAGFGGEVRAAAVTADGTRTIAGGADQSVRIFHNGRGEQLHSLTNPAGPIHSIAAAHGESPLAAAGSEQGAVTFWDVREGKPAGRLDGHQGIIHALQFLPGNERFITAGQDGTLRLWQLPQAPAETEAHSQAVTALGVSRDRKFAVTGGADRTLALWTLPAAKKSHTAEDLPQPAACVAVNDDGTLIAVGDVTGTIRLFITAKGKKLQEAGSIGAHVGEVRGLLFLPGEQGLISCGADGTWKRWRVPLTTGPALPEGEQPWRLIATTADGSRIAAEGNDRIVYLVDGTNGKLLRKLEVQPQAATDLAFDAQGQHLYRTLPSGVVQVIDVESGQVLQELAGHQGTIHDLAAADTGPSLATAGEDGTIRIWNVPPAPIVVPAHEAAVAATAASRDGRVAATAAQDGSLIVWNTSSLKVGKQPAAQVRQLVAPKPLIVRKAAKDTAAIAALAFAADGSALYTGDAAGRLQAWDTAAVAKAADGQGAAVTEATVVTTAGSAVTALAVAADQGVLVSAHSDGVVRRWALPLPTVDVVEGLPASPMQAISADRKRLAVAGESAVKLFDVAERKQVRTLENAPDDLMTLAWSPAANRPYLAAGGKGGRVTLWNAADGQVLAAFAASKADIKALAFSPDGAALVTADIAGKVQTWQVESVIQAIKAMAEGAEKPAEGEAAQGPMPSQTLEGHQGAVRAVMWSADGQQIYTAGDDKTVRVWNAADGKAVKTLVQHAAAVHALATSKQQGLLVSASTDKQIRITKLADGAEAAVLASPEAALALDVSPDGHRLAAALTDGSVAVWDLASSQLLQGLPPAVGKAAGKEDAAVPPSRLVAWLADDAILANLGPAAGPAVAKIAAVSAVKAHEGAATAVAISADAAQVFTAGQDKQVKLWDAQGHEVRSFAGPAAAVRAVAIDSAGRVAASGDENAIYLWTVADGKAVGKFQTTAATRHLAFVAERPANDEANAKAETPMLAASMVDGRIRCFDQTGGLVREIVSGTAAGGPFAAVGDGRTILAPTPEHAMRFSALALERILTGHEGAVAAVAFLPESKQLVSGGADRSVRLWDREQGALVRTFSGAANAITAVAFAPEPKLVIATGADKQLRAWNLDNGQAAYTVELPVAATRLSADGTNHFVSSGNEATARLWDARQGKQMQLFAHGGVVSSAAVTADGAWIITAGSDKQLLRTANVCQQVVPAHDGKANAVAVSADGKQIVTAGNDRVVKLWTVEGEMVRQLGGASTALAHVAISPDGSQVAAGGDPQRTVQDVLVWKAEDGSLISRLATGSAVVCLGFDGDGRRLIVGGADSKMRSYEAEPLILGEVTTLPAVPTAVSPHPAADRYLVAGNDGKLRGVTSHLQQLLLGHEGAVHALAASADGKLIYSGGADKTVRQWNLETGEAARTFDGSGGAVLALELSPDGSLLLAGGADKVVRSWNATNGQPAWQETLPQAVRALHLVADGKRLVVASDDPLVRVFDLASDPGKPRLQETFTGHGSAVRSVAASADGSMIVSGGADNTLRQWHSVVVTAAVAHGGAVRQVAFTPDGGTILTAGEDGKALAWNGQSLERVRSLVDGKTPLSGIAVDPANEHVAVIGDDGTLQLLRRESGEPVAAWKTEDKLRAVAFGYQGQILAGGESGRIVNLALLDDGSLSEIQQFTEHTGPVLALAATESGEFYSTSADRSARRWFAATAAPRHVLAGHERQVVDLAFMADNVLVSASADGTARRWNLAEGGEAIVCQGHDGCILAMACRREGNEILTAGDDGTLRLWNENGEAVAQWTVPQTAGTVYAAAWAPNGRYLVTAGSAGQWQRWDRQTSGDAVEPVQVAPGHSASVTDIAWQAAGQRYATVDQSGKLFVWNAGDGNLLYHAQLPVPAAYGVAYSPDGKELAVATTDQRLVILALPSFAQ